MIKQEKTSQGQAVFIQENEYNQDGQRVSRTENGTTRSYYYDNGAVAFTRDGNSVSSANILSTSQEQPSEHTEEVHTTAISKMYRKAPAA